MIARIDAIQNFGIFRDFRWGRALPEFSTANLLYGWNYSGKTTLSRVFQAMEEKVIPEAYVLARFTVALDDGSRITSSDLSSSPRVRVFNRDFIRRNFREQHTAPAVFVLGEESVALRERLRHLTLRREHVVDLLASCAAKREEIQAQADRAGTDRARDIGELLGVRDFRRPNLESRIEEVRSDPESHILPDELVGARLQTARSVEQYAKLELGELALPDLAGIVRDANELLGQSAANRAIARLKENAQIEEWVREGLDLHSSTKRCEFCRNVLADERLSELRGHFSEAYEKLFAEIESMVVELGTVLPHPIDLDELRVIPEQRQRFAEAKSRFSEWLVWARGLRDDLVELLRAKQGALDTPKSWTGDIGRAEEAARVVEDIKQAIDEHNRAVEGLDSTRVSARGSLEKHYAALYLRDGGVLARETEIARRREKEEQGRRILRRLDSQINALESKVKQSSVGAAKLNQLVKYLLADSNIDVVPLGDRSFQFTRDGRPAVHLSDGEATALTLAYFVVGLEGGGASVEESIVFVDDPVSSLDSNHIYAVYALIVERLATAHQLFVATHNSELFNLLKSKWLERYQNDKHTRAYHVRRERGATGEARAEICDLPYLLRAYKSEYEFVFSQLKGFAEAASPTLYEAYTAANLLRKFLEAYLGFRKARPRRWSEKLDVILDDATSRREVQKFADEESHLQSLGRALEHSDIVANAQRCVTIVLDGLKEKDPGHYKSLLAVVDGDEE